jgi:hypothetical protein
MSSIDPGIQQANTDRIIGDESNPGEQIVDVFLLPRWCELRELARHHFGSPKFRQMLKKTRKSLPVGQCRMCQNHQSIGESNALLTDLNSLFSGNPSKPSFDFIIGQTAQPDFPPEHLISGW